MTDVNLLTERGREYVREELLREFRRILRNELSTTRSVCSELWKDDDMANRFAVAFEERLRSDWPEDDAALWAVRYMRNKY